MESTHGVNRVSIGGSNFLTSDNGVYPIPTNGPPITLNYLDCFPFSEAQGPNKEAKFRVSKREGQTYTVASGTSAFTSGNPGITVIPSVSAVTFYYFSVGNNIYQYDTSVPVGSAVTLMGATTGAMAVCGGTMAINNSNAYTVAFLDLASRLYTFSDLGTGFTTTNITAAGSVTGFRNLVFIDGYLFAANATSIYNSDPAGDLTTWNSTNFISAEQYADEIVWLEKHHNYLVVFSDSSTEFFYDAAIEVGSPLARQLSYSQRIGMKRSERNKNTAIIDDDIYFVGITGSDNLALYRLRDFKIKCVSDNFFESYVNLFPLGNSWTLYSVDTLVINNVPMIATTFTGNLPGTGTYTFYTLVFDPETEQFWVLNTAGTIGSSNTDWPPPVTWIGTTTMYQVTRNTPLIFALNEPLGTQLRRYYPDNTSTVSVTSVTYTDVIDFGTNRWKSFPRIDAIGDFGTNTLTLAFNPTPNYSTSYTNCTPSQVASTIGYGNNISWYNLGAARRWSFKFTMTGDSSGYLEGFDIEYDVGSA